MDADKAVKSLNEEDDIVDNKMFQLPKKEPKN